MPKLYTMPGTCALAPNIAVAWLGAPIEIANMAYGDHKKDAYLAINPRAQVPALVFDDGDVLTEAAAILAHIGAAYGKESYARDERLGRKEALSYMTSEVHGAYGPHFAAARYADGEAAQAEVKRKSYDRLHEHFVRLEKTLNDAGGEWYLGRRSFADAYLYVLTRWIKQTPLSIDDYPALKGHRARMEADEKVGVALKRQGMDPVG
ncbi:MAG: glutathione S-transferase [Geminicoccaceae bacterium]|nr:glutathione S-transferase [Geminicoccaceae bacterium]